MIGKVYDEALKLFGRHYGMKIEYGDVAHITVQDNINSLISRAVVRAVQKMLTKIIFLLKRKPLSKLFVIS